MFIKGMKAALELVKNPDDYRRLSLYIETLENNQALYLERCKPGVSDKIAEEFAEKMLTGMNDLATIAHQDNKRLKHKGNTEMTTKELVKQAKASPNKYAKVELNDGGFVMCMIGKGRMKFFLNGDTPVSRDLVDSILGE